MDANGNRTSWERDVQGRVTREVRANGSFTTYAYETTTSRLKTVTDPKQQTTTYTYALDDALLSTAYTNAVVPTPGVTLTYDVAWPGRVTSMVDGIGSTLYNYQPVGQVGATKVASVDGPLSNDTITYSYDQLGRVTSRGINGVAVTWTFDALGRVTTEANTLGTFTYTYDGPTGRVATVSYPNSQTSTYSYYSTAQDHRLQTIHHKYPTGATLSKFDYTYDVAGNIRTWRQQTDTTAVTWEYGHDTADQLIAAVKKATDPQETLLKRYAYVYDASGNRTAEQIDDQVTGATYDTMNRLLSQQPAGPVVFAGTVSEPATVTVAGQSALVTTDNRFQGTASVTAGTTAVAVVATDPSGNATIKQYEVDSTGVTRTFTYDANGNLISDGSRTFEWDARNQLVAVTVGTHRSEFMYDGQQRRVRVVEKENGATVSDRKLVWCNEDVCEERDGSASHVKWILGIGEASDVHRFLTRDHLGSVRDVSTVDATRVATYEYDPYGRTSLTSGSEQARDGFAGYVSHSSGLRLAMYRAYSPDIGRWLSRDPAGLSEGPNLYLYVRNDPASGIDPLGDSECKDCAITIKCRPVGHWIKYLGAEHCFAQLRLEDGTIIRREGGRSLDGTQLIDQRNDGPGDGRTMWSRDPSSCDKVNCVAKGSGGGGNYNLFINSSSTWLNRLLVSCGYPVVDTR